MIQSPAGYQGDVRIKRYLDFYQAGYGVAMLSSGTTAFSPASLFAANEQGVWYDPSDLSTLFQDAAGTTPVSAMEQPVGLVLDKSRGLVLGSELVTNGDFSNGSTGWSLGAGANSISVVGGRLEIATTSGFAGFRAVTAITTVIGRAYRAQINTSIAGTRLLASNNSDGSAQYFTATLAQGDNICYFTATATTTYIAPAQAGGSTATFSIDNISVRELPGNHASQTTAASRPVVSARYNLLTYTEDFSQAIWVKSFCTASAMNVADPVGGTTASTITATANSGFFYHNASSSTSTVSNSIWVRRRTGTGAIRFRTAAGGTDTDYSSSITSSWSLLTWQCTPSGSANMFVISLATSGDAIDLWHPDLRVSNDGVGLPAYQRVTTATDYDTTGFPLYLRFDGTDDSLATGSIDFTATDKMSVFAGVRKLSDVNSSFICELSATSSGNTGTFALWAPLNAATANYGFRSKGTSTPTIATPSSSYAAPLTSVLTGLGNIPSDVELLRVNSVQAASETGDQGVGAFGNYPLYIGARFNAPPTTPSSSYFNGRIYSLIVRGAASTDAQIASTETWVNGKTKAYV